MKQGCLNGSPVLLGKNHMTGVELPENLFMSTQEPTGMMNMLHVHLSGC